MQAPRDKLICVLNCCRVINNLLHVQVQQGEARGAQHAVMLGIIATWSLVLLGPPCTISQLMVMQII